MFYFILNEKARNRYYAAPVSKLKIKLCFQINIYVNTICTFFISIFVHQYVVNNNFVKIMEINMEILTKPVIIF